ncbi:hypothetical protein Hamer_G003864 [Homarus americanus]|uniref:Uncharacterized protein n=1 Tax=Homarus americanus TaxID=6706 RepID=A0A8J5TLW9_HOMAM|nr:hypothetical protein Hamer_G003864 [Homarus americanus]
MERAEWGVMERVGGGGMGGDGQAEWGVMERAEWGVMERVGGGGMGGDGAGREGVEVSVIVVLCEGLGCTRTCPPGVVLAAGPPLTYTLLQQVCWMVLCCVSVLEGVV